MQKKAFSFVEIIIVISILALLGVIGLKFYSDADNDSNNSKAISDITTVNNSIQSYFEQEKILPNPKGNISYFGSGSEYVHVDNGDENDSTKSFGKHGFVTQDLLPKKYLNYLPIDPRTNQFYAYGKTTDDNFYEIAGVVKIDGKYKSKVVGNYPGEYGPYSLIREYNGPDFVGNNSSQSFPYNPDEKIIVAKINSFSGTVTISSDNYSISSSTTPDQILEHTLVEGDTIEVTSGGQADIYYSDGSQSSLGDSSQDSSLTIAKMIFDGEENLVTKISLALESGTLWTKAPELNSDGSNFEVYTTDTSASVRGTIFAVKADSSNKTIVTVEKGTVEVKKIEKKSDNTSINNIDELIESIQSENIKKDNITISGVTSTENGNTVIKVTGTDSPKTGNITNTSSSSNISPLELENFSSNLNFQIEEVNINLSGTEEITNFIIPIEQFSKKINSIAFINDNGIYLSKVDNSLEKLTLDSNTEFFNTNTDFTQTKKEQNSLYLKNIELSTSTPLSNIIKNKNKLEIYLCKYSNKYLKCGGKRDIQIKNNKLKSKDEEERKNLEKGRKDRDKKNDDKVFRERPTEQPCTANPTFEGYNISELSHNEEKYFSKNNGYIYSYGDTNNITGNKTQTGKVKCNNGTLSLVASSETESISCNTGYSQNINNGNTYCDIINQGCLANTNFNGYNISSLSHEEELNLTKNTGNIFSYGNSTNITGNKTQSGKIKCNNLVLSLEHENLETITCNSGFSKFEADLNGDGTDEIYCEEKVDGKELYAFAPYDIAGDLDLYDKVGDTISKNSDKIIGNAYGFESYCDYLYDENNSFCEKNGEKGIFIDNSSNDDFLKYFNLELDDDFVIEMSVRGEDLKRSNKNKYFTLIKKGNLKLILKSYSSENSLKLYKDTSPLINIPNNEITKNGFYQILINFNKSYNNYYIDNNLRTITINTMETNSDDLLIGTNYKNNTYKQQWNGIINYLKLFY